MIYNLLNFGTQESIYLWVGAFCSIENAIEKAIPFTMRHNYDTVVLQKRRCTSMPIIMPIRDLRKTSELSELAHKKQEPIFITKNGYSDLVVMSSELYEKFAYINKVDQAIEEAERGILWS